MSVRFQRFLTAMCVAACGCASSGAASSGATTTAPAAAAAPSSGYHFTAVAMAITPPPGPTHNGWVPTVMDADGRLHVSTDRLGRVERDRVMAESGQVLLQINPDGTLSMPWNTNPDAPRLRLTAQGMEAVSHGTTTLLTVNDQGEYAENGTPSGARVAPYAAANRDSALLMRFVHAIAFMQGMAAANAAGNTAVTPAH